MQRQPQRQPNPRGAGQGLREEILAATERLLSRTPAEPPVTLRAIARETGVAAPSIYAHFAARDDIIDAVVARVFSRLAASCAEAAGSSGSIPDRVRRMSFAYLRFAHEHPGQYRTAFERTTGNIAAVPHPIEEGLSAFQLMDDLLQQLASADTTHTADPSLDAQALLLALHGYATLPNALPGFPWRNQDELVDQLVRRFTAASPS